MSVEPRSKSEATVRLPKISAESTVQVAAPALEHLAAPALEHLPKGEASPPPVTQLKTKVAGTAHPTKVVRPPLSPLEKAQRRLMKNLVMGGVFVVVLVIVFYLLSR